MNHPAIIVDQNIQGGTPVFSGTRVPIKNLFDYLQGGGTLDEFLLDFPSVPRPLAMSVLELAQHALVRDAHPA